MKHKVVVIALFIIIFFFIGRHCSFLGSSAVGTVSSCLLYPVLRIQQLVVEPIQLWLSKREAVRDLKTHYLSLQKEYEELLAENIALQSMRYYTQETSELSDFKKRYSQKNAHIAQVLARHFSAQNQFFLVNVGARQGIKKDMVAVYKNCLIGRVAQVYPWYCKVCLVTDAECKVAAVCSKTGASGILEGVNNRESMVLQYVSHLDNIEENEMIISSGDGLIFPNGFGLGTIAHIHKEDLFYTIRVKPLLDFQSLRYCIVLSKDEIENGRI